MVADNVIEVLEYAFNKLGIAFEWTADTIVPYMNEAVSKYAAWKCGVNIFGACIGVVLLVGGIVLTVVVSRYMTNHTLSDRYAWYYLSIPMIISGLVIIIVCVCMYVKIYNFPELAFAEWVSGLMRTF